MVMIRLSKPNFIYHRTSKDCGEVTDVVCYEEVGYIESYLNNTTTRALIGASLDKPFALINYTVNSAFRARGDESAGPIPLYVAGLLERGIRVLIYAGSYDWICNWVSNMLWVESMEWSGHQDYILEKWNIWGVDAVDDSVVVKRNGQVGEADRIKSKGAGVTKRAGPLTFATIWGAGHMISLFFCVSFGIFQAY